MKRKSPPDLGPLVASLSTVEVERVFLRSVPQLDFVHGVPPRFFWTSGRPNRLNPRGIACIYLSDTELTANMEWAHAWAGLPGDLQPKLTFHVRVRVERATDLCNASTAEALGLDDDDLFGNWRLAMGATRLQSLGALLAKRKAATAVLYPSAAGRALRAPGTNIAVFVAALRRADRLEVIGPDDLPLEVFP